MEYFYTFQGNEIVTGISILSVLSLVNKMEITKCLIIEPLLNHNALLKMLSRKNSNVRSIEELIIKKQEAFNNFSDRYKESVLLSINSIMLMSQMGLLKIDNDSLIFLGHDFNFSEKSLGKMTLDRISAGKKITRILERIDAASLYLALRIEL